MAYSNANPELPGICEPPTIVGANFHDSALARLEVLAYSCFRQVAKASECPCSLDDSWSKRICRTDRQG